MKKKSLNVKKKNHKYLLKHLKKKKIYRVFKTFSLNLKSENKLDTLACGISGGPDSLALAFLSKCYEIIEKKKFYFFIVDHGLRKDSYKEAKLVKLKLSKFDINCKILQWKGKISKSNIQSFARNVRYSLLNEECERKKISTLLTAHHFDDLHENFYLRIMRGSGLKGISSFGDIYSFRGELKILRPLITIKKSELISITRETLKFYIDDPSNENKAFKRVKIREFIKNLNLEGLGTNKIKLTLNNLKQANLALDYFANENLRKNSNFYNFKKNVLISDSFLKAPKEVVIRSLSEILKKVGNKYYPPRGKSINKVIEFYRTKNSLKTTLGGCVMEKINNSVIIYKES